MESNTLLRPGPLLDGWLGWPDPITRLVVLCPNFEFQGQSGDRRKLSFFIICVYCVLSPGARLLECRLCIPLLDSVAGGDKA